MEIALRVPSAWKQPPLRNPSSQIRLLWIHNGHDDDEIRCAVSIWDLKNAPEYRGISYAWGSPDPKAFINITSTTLSPGSHGFEVMDWARVKVRENARYALWQARLHYPGSYLWIDSICINQTNLREKTAQVAMMAEIYGQAEMVIACVGPSDESSDAIYELCHYLDLGLDRQNPRKPFDYRKLVNGPLWSKFEHLEQSETLNGSILGMEMRDCWNGFTAREYWSRLWIIQEMHSARNRQIQVVCGDLITDWYLVAKLASLLQGWGVASEEQDGPKMLICHIMDVITIDQKDSLGEEDCWFFWQDLAYFSCEDDRDRVYGVLGVFPWERAGIPKPTPDYEVSCFDLAVQLIPETGVLREYSVVTATQLLRLDELSISDLTQQFRASNSLAQFTKSSLTIYDITITAVCLIQQDIQGRLYIAPQEANQGVCAAWRRSARGMKSLRNNGQEPIEIFGGE